MQNHDVEKMLTQNKLLPKIDMAIMNAIARDMFSGEYYMPGETIAKCLHILGSGQLVFLSSKANWEDIELNQDNIGDLVKGFTYFLLIMQKGYISSHSGIDKYREMYPLEKNSKSDITDEYLVLALGLLVNKPWGEDFAKLIIQTESEKDHNLFFKTGLEVGYRTFIKYIGIFQLLNIYEISLLNEEINTQKLRVNTMFPQPNIVLKSTEKQTQRNNISSRLISEKEEHDLVDTFQKAVDNIIDVNKRNGNKAFSEEEDNARSQLLNIESLDTHFAFFSFIHLSVANYFEKKYIYTKQIKYIQKAKDIYSIPVNLYSFWANDLGTRYACDYKLLRLIIENFHELGLSLEELHRTVQYYCLDAIKINERMYIKSTYDDSRAIIQGRIDGVLGILIENSKFQNENKYTGDINNFDLLRIIDNNKSKLLNLEISLLEIDTPPGPSNLYEKEKYLLSRLRSIRTKQHSVFRPEDYNSGLAELQEFPKIRLELEEIWCELEDYSDETKRYVAFRRNGISYLLENDIKPDLFDRTQADTAFITFFLVQGCIYSLFIKPDQDISIINSENISNEDLWGYFHSYRNEIIQRNDLSSEHYWQRLGDLLFSKLKKHLTNVKRLCIVPHRELHQIPFHALTIEGKTLIDEWEIYYSPSLKVLQTTTKRKNNHTGNLVMGYAPPGSNPIFKDAIESEVIEVSSILKTSPVKQEKAIRQLIPTSHEAEVIHIAGHGYFNEKNPLSSGVQLADGYFSASDWLKIQLSSDLVTLSACQTGLSEIKLGDELLGLSRAILFAGSSSLLTTLWEVEGKSTRNWMINFYSTLYNTKDQKRTNKSLAFKNATQLIKKEYKDPYYWAPFMLIGNPV